MSVAIEASSKNYFSKYRCGQKKKLNCKILFRELQGIIFRNFVSEFQLPGRMFRRLVSEFQLLRSTASGVTKEPYPVMCPHRVVAGHQK